MTEQAETPRSREKLEALFEAYRCTSFCADTPAGRLRIRVGERSGALDALLAAHAVRTWAYITAWNPGSVALSESENRSRQQALESELGARGLPVFRGEGIGDDGRWSPEPSVLVLGLSEADGRALGARFGQIAIVAGELQGPARLVACEN